MLSGAVKSADVKTKVGEFAKAQPEVKAVYNDIIVTDAGGLKQTANDVTIKGKLKAQLLAEKGVSSINYIYQVVNGYVFIICVAESQAELDKVMQIARGIADVRQVVSHIRVDASRKKAA
jgi:osmotically-inducible protein OsmY